MMKASLSLSEEVEIDRLLKNLIHVVMENAGAEECWIFYKVNDGFRMGAYSKYNDELFTRLIMEKYADRKLSEMLEVPQKVIEYVIRSKKPMMAEDARSSFVDPDFGRSHKSKSVLCMPIINKGHTIAVLYLENKHISGVFTQERIYALKLLEGQMAVSLENAVLISKLRAQMAEIESKDRVIRHEMEVAVQANQAKSIFLSNISHELRTPMHGILSFSRFGQSKIETASKEKLKYYFDSIYESGSRLMVLLNDLLDLSQLEAGQMKYDMKRGNLLNVIRQVEGEFEPLAMERGLKLEVTLDSQVTDTDLIGVFDGFRIAQVTRNIISNAIKFSYGGTVIQVKLTRQLDDKIGFVVINQGKGIPENELESIFDKFTQSSLTRTGAGGTGLGLAICKEIILQHSGKIWAESDSTGETRFFVEIPREGGGSLPA